ncbi:Ribonuclease H [compost metagenome]
MANQKFYVVWEGKTPGVYTSWAECQTQVSGVTGAKFKAFPSKAEAEKAFAHGWKGIWGNVAGTGKTSSGSKGSGAGKGTARSGGTPATAIDYDSISVDVGTRGNPGPVEYKGVDTRTGEILFSCGPIAKGTNNLGEFLAIVHGLAYLKSLNSNKTVYSDSVNALKWVRQKKAVSTLTRDESTREIWDLVDRAERWLQNNTYANKVVKWETKSWGEIKADYGRK